MDHPQRTAALNMTRVHVYRSLVMVLCLLSAGCKRTQETQVSAITAVSAPAPAQPPKPTNPALARGSELYTKMCAVCHGEHGEGYKADNAPALNQQDLLAAADDGFLGYTIADGRPGTTMSAWSMARGGPLADGDIRALIALIRSWQTVPMVKLDEGPVVGAAQRGKQLFERACERCHADAGPHVRVKSHEFLANASTGFLRHALRVGRAPGRMPSFQSELGNEGMEDVVAYLRSLPTWSTPEAPASAQRPPPLPLGPVPLNPSGPLPNHFNKYPQMTGVDTVHAELERGARMALLDARAPSDYMTGHITGAVSVPFYDPSPYLAALPKDAWLVCYCGCPHAESGVLAEQLLKAGFEHVTVLDEGLGVWVARGHEVSAGTDP